MCEGWASFFCAAMFFAGECACLQLAMDRSEQQHIRYVQRQQQHRAPWRLRVVVVVAVLFPPKKKILSEVNTA